MSGVSATDTTAKTTHGSHVIDENTAAIAPPRAPKAMHTKKKCVGGGRISRMTNATQAISQYLYVIIVSPLCD